ncbi:MAG: Crp/Fnr family transcriptional regulator [Chitinophagales bacterium]|nr:Crp/Fnr family transcriptional regulator [Chitinophagales bacterium]
METTVLLDNVRRYIQLTPAEEKTFLSFFEFKKIKKKQFLLHQRSICPATAFVLNGCLRGYTIDDNGFEHILQFAPQDWWIADMYSVLSGNPGNLNIDAIEDTEVLLLPRDVREKLFEQIPKTERYFRILMEKSLISIRQRLMDNFSLSAVERYKLFSKTYPTIVHTLPQKYIASYIGVTPEFFSKMKKELLAKRR